MNTKTMLIPKIEKELHEKAKARARAEKTTLTTKIRELIEEYGRGFNDTIPNNP